MKRYSSIFFFLCFICCLFIYFYFQSSSFSSTSIPTSTSSSIDNSISISSNKKIERNQLRSIDSSPLKVTTTIVKEKSLRVAVLIPYFGLTLPPWFNSFMFTAQLSSDYLDWYIFTTTFINISTPNNIKLVTINETLIVNRIIQMDPNFFFQVENQEKWKETFLNLLHLYPYLLVEYKPTLGWIFEVTTLLILFLLLFFFSFHLTIEI